MLKNIYNILKNGYDTMKSESMEEHKQNAPKSIKFGVITLSDSKYRDFLESKTTDLSGNLIIDSLKKEQ